MNDQIVVFEDWEKVLRDTVPAELQGRYREAAVKFRYWLREHEKVATVEAFKEHLRGVFAAEADCPGAACEILRELGTAVPGSGGGTEAFGGGADEGFVEGLGGTSELTIQNEELRLRGRGGELKTGDRPKRVRMIFLIS